MQENQLIELVQKSGLEPAQQKPLLDSFGDFFVQAHKLATKAKGIKVTSEDQVDLMKQAKELRKQLKDLRIAADKTRIALKEGYLRGGNAVQAIYNDIEKIVKPAEQELEKSEKFAEIKEMERKQVRYEKRVSELQKYVEDVSIYSLLEMTDDLYKILLDTKKKEHEDRLEQERLAELERVEQEKKQVLLRDRRMRLEQYRFFIGGEIDKINTETTEEEFVKLLKIAKETKETHDKHEAEEKEKMAKLAKEKADLEEKIRKDREAQLAKERKEAEEARIKYEAEQRQAALEQEAQRKKLLAPDKEKLMDIAQIIDSIQLPAVSSKEAMSVIKATEDMLGKVTSYIRQKAKAL